MKKILGFLALLASLAVPAAAQTVFQPILLFSSSGAPFPSAGSGGGPRQGTMLEARCYTIVTGAVEPCNFSGGGGGMVYPAGTGIPEVTGGASWGTTYNASNLIPTNFLNLTGYLTAATAASTYAPIFTLTTTGTSGVATYSGNVLNIPQYSGGLASFTVGNLSPLFTASLGGSPTTAPALVFTLSSAAQNSVLAGPAIGGAGVPSYQTAPTISAANMTSFPTFFSALSGDATSTSTGGATSVVKVNGLALPVSALFGGWNSSHQAVAATTTNLATFLSGLTGCTTAASAYVPADGQCEALGSGSGISGGTPGQIALFGSATTITSGIAIGNTGSDIPQLSTGLLNSSVIPWAVPGTIGSGTANSGAFTTVTASGRVTATTDGTHAGIMALVGQGTNPTIPTNSFGWIAPASASFTSYFFQCPSTGPAGTDLIEVSAVSSGISTCSFISATPTYPLTISGGVSGGVVYGSSGTQLTVSPAGTVNVLMKWGGAGSAPGDSSITDNGTTATSTDTGGFVAPVFVANGTTAGFFDFAQGTTSAAVAPCNTPTSICFQAPTLVTSQLRVFAGAPATGFSLWTNVSGTMTETLTGTQGTVSTGPALFGSSAVNTVVAQTIAAYAGHFTNLVATSSLGGTCTTAPTFNVFDGTTNVGTAKLSTSTTQTKGTSTSQTQSLTFAAGDQIGIYISVAGGSCTTDTWVVSAQYSEP